MNPSPEEALFQFSLAKPAEKRAAWLERECGEDKALQQHLEAMLAAHEQPDRLLATQTEPVWRTHAARPRRSCKFITAQNLP